MLEENAQEEKKWFKQKTWNEFRDSGLLFFVNTILHAFGWAITMDIDSEGNIFQCQPARVAYRGFGEQSLDRGYKRLSDYLAKNAPKFPSELKNGLSNDE